MHQDDVRPTPPPKTQKPASSQQQQSVQGQAGQQQPQPQVSHLYLFILTWSSVVIEFQSRGANRIFLFLYKGKGSHKDPKSYRGITLSCMARKLFEFCLAERFRKALEDSSYFQFFQSAFRQKRSVDDNLAFIDSLYRSTVRTGNNFHLGFFFHLETAFPKVLRQLLLNELEADGFPYSFRAIVATLFDNDLFSVLVNGVPGNFFVKNKGLQELGIQRFSNFLYLFFRKI